MHIPEKGELKFPSRLDPAPYGVIGTLYMVHIFAIADACSVDLGRTMATDFASMLVDDHSQ